MARFLIQLSLATAVVGSAVGGLAFLRSSEAASPSLAHGAAADGANGSSAGSVHPALDAPASNGPGSSPTAGDRAGVFSARSLIPESAWVVADFRGGLAGPAPFAGQLEGPCGQVPAPQRLALGLLPPAEEGSAGGANAEMDLFLGAPSVGDDFWQCAKKRVLLAGGTTVGEEQGFEVLKSPSGVLIRSPEGHLVFTTNGVRLKQALALASGRPQGEQVRSAQLFGPHAALAASLTPQAAAPGSSAPGRGAAEDVTSEFVVTIHLPRDWLAGAGPDSADSPLRHLQAAALVGRSDGSALGALHCEEPGCLELARFLDRSRTDIEARLPANLQARVGRALTAELVSGPSGGSGRIVLRWSGAELPLTTLLGQLLPGTGMAENLLK